MVSKTEELLEFYKKKGYRLYKLDPKIIVLTLLLPFVAIIPHELGHYLLAYRFQLAPEFVAGGVRMGVLEIPLNEWFLVTLGGPVAGALFLLIAWRLARLPKGSVIVQGLIYTGLCFFDLWTLYHVLRIMLGV